MAPAFNDEVDEADVLRVLIVLVDCLSLSDEPNLTISLFNLYIYLKYLFVELKK